MKLIITNYKSHLVPTWCPGCHNFLLPAGLQQSFSALNLKSKDIVIAYDIGCAGNMADFLKTYGLHTLHGRALSTAMGVKIYRPDLTVCVIGGDGGLYGEGLNHLVAAARSGTAVKVFVSNNRLYSLTTGQTSPTTPKGSKTKSTPQGTPNLPVNPIAILKSVNPDIWAESVDSHRATFLFQKITDALRTPGFALLDLLQNCAAFGKQLSG